MKICPKCNSLCEDSASFCQECGAPLPAPCRGGWTVLFRRAALDRSLAPAPEVRHTRSGQRPTRRNISVTVLPAVSGSAPWRQCL